jgi:hypothetical protein
MSVGQDMWCEAMARIADLEQQLAASEAARVKAEETILQMEGCNTELATEKEQADADLAIHKTALGDASQEAAILRAELHEFERERDELRRENAMMRQQRDELAAANALIIKRVLAQLTTTKESPQWTTVDFNYMVASIRGTLSATDPAAILLAHDREKDQKIAELSGAWASLMKAIESDGGTLSVGGIPVGENVRALAQMHDAALVKPLVEALRTVQKSIEHRTDKSPYEVCYDWCPACQIDAALTPYREKREQS